MQSYNSSNVDRNSVDITITVELANAVYIALLLHLALIIIMIIIFDQLITLLIITAKRIFGWAH